MPEQLKYLNKLSAQKLDPQKNGTAEDRLGEQMGNSFILQGNICHTPHPGSLELREHACLVCEEGICRGIFDETGRIPEQYRDLEVIDCADSLILPGMVDLHIHAPQYTFRGTGMDYELLEWLDRVTFPEEIRYADPGYAARAYEFFSNGLKQGATTRAVIFGTIHVPSTLILMDYMEKSGLVSFVGKVNMDRYAPPELTEKSASEAEADTRLFIEESRQRGYRRTKPIITPRFVPTCTKELMEALGKLRREYDLPVQSHLSENPGEVELVAELEPEAAFYGDAYDRYGLFGREGNTVMAHGIYSTPEEMQRIRENGVWIAHCPASNMNLASGIAPVRRFLEKGIRVGLGTDVAGGFSDSIFRAMTDAIQVSNLYWRYIDSKARPLRFAESFYLATKGGGAFFGKVGSFEDGYEFDAVVLDDSCLQSARPLTLMDRLERAVYLELDRETIAMKFAAGERIL